MAKLTKHAEMVAKLHELVVKQADLTTKHEEHQKTEVSKDIDTSIKKETGSSQLPDEAISKAKQDATGSEHLKQTTADQSGTKTESKEPAKTASEKGKEILNLIAVKQAEGMDKQPGTEEKKEVQEKVPETLDKDIKDTGSAQTPAQEIKKPEQDTVGSDKLKQTTADQSGTKTENKEPAKTASEVEKIAAYEIGRQFAVELLKKASAPTAEQEKQAGARDFDAIIAAAAEELNKTAKVEKTASMDKEAEELGAQACDAVMALCKQAAIEQENEALKVKLAEYEGALAFDKAQAEKVAYEKAAQEAEVAEAKKFATLAEKTASIVLEQLKKELATPATK